jgi:quercetin dioxygenase-like cupin family protein
MTEQLKEIGMRLSTLREINGLTAERMAEKLDLDVEDYLKFESGEEDFSFSFLSNAAAILGVDVVEIITGDTPKLTICSLVRKGGGFDIARNSAYDYKHLAFTFKNKLAEPFMVTDNSFDSPNIPALHSHDGQEFNYVVAGSMEFHLGDVLYVLNEGDSIYFDASIPHAYKALGGAPAKFLAVVIKNPGAKSSAAE